MDNIAYDPADSHVLFDLNFGVVTCNFPDPDVVSDAVCSPFENFAGSTHPYLSGSMHMTSSTNSHYAYALPASRDFDMTGKSLFNDLSLKSTSSSESQTRIPTVCEVNLDSVPMDVVTSDCESPEPNYSAVFSETLDESFSDSSTSTTQQYSNPSADLEEIELRSRALRSLLLKRQPKVSNDWELTSKYDAVVVPMGSTTPTSTSVPVGVATTTTTTTTTEKSNDGILPREILTNHLTAEVKAPQPPVSILLKPPQDKLPARRKFVITLNQSSDSETDSESDEDRETPTVFLSRMPVQIIPTSVTLPPPAVAASNTAVTAATTAASATATVTVQPPISTAPISHQIKPTEQTIFQQAKLSRLKHLETAVLQSKMEYLKLKLTAKRQQRIVDEQKKVVRKHSQTLLELRKQLKTTTNLYKNASATLSKANRLNLTYQRKVVGSQKRHAELVATLEHLSRSIQPKQILSEQQQQQQQQQQQKLQTKPHSKPGPNNVAFGEQRRELVLLSLDILQRAKVLTPFFVYFQLDSQLSNTNTKPENHLKPTECPQPTVQIKTTATTAHQIDPFTPICPFSIDGDCKDKDCTYQHPLTTTKQCNIQPGKLIQAPTHLPSVQIPHNTQQAQSINRFCDVCKQDITLHAAQHDNVLQQWHALYLNHMEQVNAKKAFPYRKFKQKSGKLLSRNLNNGHLLAHHIMALLMPAQLDVDGTAQVIGNCLKSSNYPLEACEYAVKYSRLHPLMRKRIAQSGVDHLISKLAESSSKSDQTSSTTSFQPELDSFTYMIYMLCYFELYLQSSQSVMSLLDEIHSRLPQHHPMLWGLWWLKLHVNLTDALPSEASFYTDLDVPFVPKKKLLAHEQIIRSAVQELGLSDITPNSDPIIPVLEQYQSGFVSTCFMNVLHFYIQFLNATGCHQDAAQLGFRMWITNTNPNEDSFFPITVYSLACLDPTLDWSTFLSHIPDKGHQLLTISHRIEFGFLTACLAWRKNLTDLASSILIETLGNLIFLTTVDHDCVTQAYSTLLCISSDSMVTFPVGEDRFCHRGQCYLWLSYGLYHLIHKLEPSTMLLRLVDYTCSYCRNLDHSKLPGHSFARLYIYMIMCLTNLGCQTQSDTYAQVIRSTFLKHPIHFPGNHLPFYFLELVQRINLDQLESPGPRHDICVSLVDHYGARVIPTLCRSLFALGDRFLAQSLCAIERMERPRFEEFWILYGSILMTTNWNQTDSSRSGCLSLKELFEDALTALPMSMCLWRQYIKFVRAFRLPIAHIISRSKLVGMQSTITHVLGDVKPSCAVGRGLSHTVLTTAAATTTTTTSSATTAAATTSTTTHLGSMKRGYSVPNLPLGSVAPTVSKRPNQSGMRTVDFGGAL